MSLLPAEMAVWVGVLLIAVSFGTSFVSATLGLGGGAMQIALLAVLLPPAVLIPVHGVVQFGSNASRAALLLKYVKRSVVVPFALGTLLGSVASAFVFVQLPPWVVQYVIAAFVFATVLDIIPIPSSRQFLTVGVISGFLTVLFGATGLFVAAATRSLRLPPPDFVATHAALMTLQHGIKVSIFVVLGFSFAQYGGLLAAMLVSGFIGTYAGRHVLLKLDPGRLKIALNAVLVLLALRLVWIATESLIDAA